MNATEMKMATQLLDNHEDIKELADSIEHCCGKRISNMQAILFSIGFTSSILGESDGVHKLTFKYHCSDLSWDLNISKIVEEAEEWSEKWVESIKSQTIEQENCKMKKEIDDLKKQLEVKQ